MSFRGKAHDPRRLRSTRSRLLTSMALVVLVGLSAASGTWGAAFRAMTTNGGNRIESGTVKIDDNDGGSAMLSLSAAQPGATDTSCIKVSYDGSLAADVRLYGQTSGTGLDSYLSIEVTRGRYDPTEPAFDSCANFAPDATTYLAGQGQGVVYAGTLQGFPDNYAAGIVDPTSGSPESWTQGESHVYRLKVTIGDNRDAEGKSSTQVFTWEARNN